VMLLVAAPARNAVSAAAAFITVANSNARQ